MIAFQCCSGGEIGRRARLRIWFRKECGFKSLPEHFLESIIMKDRILESAGSARELEKLYRGSPAKFVRAFPGAFKEMPRKMDAGYLPAYTAWCLVVMVGFPLVFRFR